MKAFFKNNGLFILILILLANVASNRIIAYKDKETLKEAVISLNKTINKSNNRVKDLEMELFLTKEAFKNDMTNLDTKTRKKNFEDYLEREALAYNIMKLQRDVGVEELLLENAKNKIFLHKTTLEGTDYYLYGTAFNLALDGIVYLITVDHNCLDKSSDPTILVKDYDYDICIKSGVGYEAFDPETEAVHINDRIYKLGFGDLGTEDEHLWMSSGHIATPLIKDECTEKEMLEDDCRANISAVTTLMIKKGDSGAPVFNKKGNVVGMVVSVGLGENNNKSFIIPITLIIGTIKNNIVGPHAKVELK